MCFKCVGLFLPRRGWVLAAEHRQEDTETVAPVLQRVVPSCTTSFSDYCEVGDPIYNSTMATTMNTSVFSPEYVVTYFVLDFGIVFLLADGSESRFQIMFWSDLC